jgi:hypothetical protein
VAVGFIAFLGVIATLFTENRIIFGIVLVLFIIPVAVLVIVASAMQDIFVMALYTLCPDRPPAFNKDLIQNAFIPKQAGPGNI